MKTKTSSINPEINKQGILDSTQWTNPQKLVAFELHIAEKDKQKIPSTSILKPPKSTTNLSDIISILHRILSELANNMHTIPKPKKNKKIPEHSTTQTAANLTHCYDKDTTETNKIWVELEGMN